jgi:DNA-binding CsgD family transcriptional regulator
MDYPDVEDLKLVEVRILVQIANGHTYPEIARILGRKYETVRSDVRRLRNKLGLHRKALMTRWVVDHRDRIEKHLRYLSSAEEQTQ